MTPLRFASSIASAPAARRCVGLGLGGAAIAWHASQRTPACEEAAPGRREAKLLVASPAEATPSLAARCIAEALGTGIIVAGGCGAVCTSKYAGGNSTLFGVAAAWGMSVALAVYVTRAVSGAHLNPAVTCALVAIGKAPAEEAPLYIGAQCAGAFVAAGVNYAIFSAAIVAHEAAAGIARGSAASAASYAGAFGMVPNAAVVGAAGALLAEAYMTSILTFIILGAGDADAASVPAGAQPAVIGAAVAALICTFGPVTGCGMNPARDLGPRLVTLLTGWGGAATTAWYAYTVGPVIGAVAGAFAYQELVAPHTKRKGA